MTLSGVFLLAAVAVLLLAANAAPARPALGSSTHDAEVYDTCKYTVQFGDTMTKIANLLSDYLPLPSKECLKCPGGVEQCAVPAAQCPKCGHKGNYVALWKFNGACTNGNINPDKIKVGQVLQVPNCIPTIKTPTVKPSFAPTVKEGLTVGVPTPAPSFRLRRPSSPPSTDDTLSTIVQGAKKILDGVQSGINNYKTRNAPTQMPSVAPTRKPSPRPYRRKPKHTDDYTPTSTAYAAEA